MARDLDEINNLNQLSEYISRIIIPRMSLKINELLEEAKETRGKKKRAEMVKKADICDKTMCKYNRFVGDRANYSTNWIFEKDLDQSGNTRILVEPIWGSQYLKEMFWDKYDHVILMSGTILNPDMLSKMLGIENESRDYIALPCPFPKENRPIIYVKFGKMSYYEKADTFKRAVPIIKKILERNSKNKGIIHTGNYQFNKWIQNSIKNKRLLIHDSSTREKMLDHHLRSELETVLVSPSMMNGVDLKDELSRFQIILKVPFPNLMSSKIKKRLETNPDWYNWKTLVDVMQSYGRSIRSRNDWAETYVLDSCFDQVISRDMPDYFKEALKIKRLG